MSPANGEDMPQRRSTRVVRASTRAAAAAASSTKNRPTATSNRPTVTSAARQSSTDQLTNGVTNGVSHEIPAGPKMKPFMPDNLKLLLVDDWEKITKGELVAYLPSPTPVSNFLHDYETWATASHQRVRSDTPDSDSDRAISDMKEVISGIKDLFNSALGRALLYREERRQYIYFRHNYLGAQASDYYGCEHLLRLLVSLPEMISRANMERDVIVKTRRELVPMIVWLSDRIDVYLSTGYTRDLWNEDVPGVRVGTCSIVTSSSEVQE
ncbi:hypothetical protein K470DRAFT_266535 [Piedraia hortae CBS 480.64]|uniref:MRG domain-containing protein n=1 Tax=Piedraia hortae CBS 480.64 TaxID=1314780 RepID=A0A6A7BRZ6_9PEZI|nr:hypothetical protein K470DRAFT_266535 [Piedraia hortae CBS 480.64]